MRFTTHSKQRIKERTGVRYQERYKLFRQALNKGISAGETSNQFLRKYLLSKERHCMAKYYKGYVFIHSKGGKLYTMYKVPDHIMKGIKNG